ncbi:MAG TPA: hypothetical protein VMW58_13520 [Anaerolineae bacterium]|nr:hypothetical protein [Anaerolineae bacterium]
MSDKEALLRNARERGVRKQLTVLIEGTEQLTDWTWGVGKKADYITYSEPRSKRRMVKYGRGGADQPLDADVSHIKNQFGSVFGVDQDEVYRRLKHYLPHACMGYATRGATTWQLGMRKTPRSFSSSSSPSYRKKSHEMWFDETGILSRSRSRLGARDRES